MIGDFINYSRVCFHIIFTIILPGILIHTLLTWLTPPVLTGHIWYNKLQGREQNKEKEKQTIWNFIRPTEIQFRVEVQDKISERKKKKSKETKKGTKKDVCDVCGGKNKIRPRKVRALWTVEACKVCGKNFYGVEKRI